jgi:hypothetical protein
VRRRPVVPRVQHPGITAAPPAPACCGCTRSRQAGLPRVARS